MAAHKGRRGKRRGKRETGERKLLLRTNVEVRYFDEGLKGSWHNGVVIGCGKSVRLVEYANLWDDDGCSKLKERIFVSSAVEGQVTACGTTKSYRGHIRPLPSNSNPQESTLTYGLCVDALVDEAWWEGVIFDHEEGSEERLVFFPDQGDQDTINVNKLRVTWDWDEVSGDWCLRGDWLFIRSLQKYKGSLPVSVRQIWYDVRTSGHFRHDDLEWMHGEWALWDKLVSEAVQENVCAACSAKAVTVAGSVSVKDAEALPIHLSKRYKTSKSNVSVSVEVSRDKFALQSSYQCVNQDNQVIQPIHTFPSDSSAATLPALDVGPEDGGCRSHKYGCDELLSTCSKVSLPLHSDPTFVVPDSVVNFYTRNATFEAANGDLGNKIRKGTDPHYVERASTCHQPSLDLPLDLDSVSLKLAKNLDSEGFDFHSVDTFLPPEMSVVANDSQRDVLAMLALPFCPHNKMEGPDIRTESMFQDQSFSECNENSSSGEGDGTVHPCGGDDEDLEAIVQDNGGKTDVIFVDQVAEPNFNAAFWGGEAYEASGEEESWKPLGEDLLPVADPQAIRKYCALAVSSKKRCGNDIVTNVNMDLLSLGWKNESEKGEDPLKLKTCYVSPDGDVRSSFPEGVDLKKRKRKFRSPRNSRGYVRDNNDVVYDDQVSDSISNPARGDSEVHHPSSIDHSWKPLQEEAAYSPLAPTEYCEYVAQKDHVSQRIIASKVKRHLLFMGWRILFRCDEKMRDRTRYVSPDNRTFMSLHQACVHVMREDKKCQCTMKDHAGVDKKSICNSDALSVESIRSEPNSVSQEQVDAEGNCSPSCSEDQVVNVSKQVFPAFPFSNHVNFKPVHCLHAVKDYLKFRKEKRKDGSVDLELRKNSNQLRSKAKLHLLADGWSLCYKLKPKPKRNMFNVKAYYRSPSGKDYHSLRHACKAWVKDDNCRKKVKDPPISTGSKYLMDTATSTKLDYLLHRQSGFGSTCASSLLRSSGLGSGTVQLKGIRTQRKRRDVCLFSFPSELLHNDRNACLPSHSMMVDNVEQDGLGIVAFDNKKRRHSGDLYPARKLKKRKDSCSVATRCAKANPMRVLRSSNREPHVVASCSSQPTIRTVLSWLIDNDVVLPRQKVSYRHQKDHHVMAEGQITREGIRCKCCKKVHSLSGFEAHAGSTNHRPAANIFLEDGRSLLECQLKIVNDMFKGLRSDTHERLKGDYSQCESDSICSICHYGGNLILCDYCPSAFHLSCIGLEDVPKGKWSCSSCQCGICGESEFNADIEQLTAQSILYCDQCEREFHVGCLRKRCLFRRQSCAQGYWFCDNRCSKIFVSLQKLLGKSKPTAVKGLSWTILRSKKVNGPDPYTCDVETMAEHHSKLCVATSVLHECFVPLIEPRTKSDLVTDILFNRRSELKRLNFGGFYTLILERGDELISVATIRIHGNKVAEIPLVGTRVQYRRQGMCRLLLNELEKMLHNLSVERLVLPAAPQLLETWTNSFGFAKMTSFNRRQLLEYTFLEFQDSIMCQKLLMPSTIKAMESRGTKVRFMLSRSTERNDAKSVSVPEPVQVVDPTTVMPSVDVQGYLLHGEAGMGRETIALSSWNGDHSSGPAPSVQETEQTDQRNPISTDVGAGEVSITPALTGMVCPVATDEKMMDPKCRFQGLFYRRKKDASNPDLFRAVDLSNDSKFGNKALMCYRRRRSISSCSTSSSRSLVA